MKEVDKATEGHNNNEERPSLLVRSVDIVGDRNFPKGCEFSTGALDPRPIQDAKVTDVVNDESKVSKFCFFDMLLPVFIMLLT
jgi:hypothetical protein